MIHSKELGGDGQMGKTIAIAFSLALAAGASLAQASKPKAATRADSSVQATTTPVTTSAPSTATQNLSSSRTTTRRPADLDPRIPWLDDLGMPQSGGPEPLVLVKEVRTPPKRHLVSLTGVGDALFMIVAHGIKTVNLIRTNLDGDVIWTVTLTGMVEWRVLVEGDMAIAVPIRVDPSVNREVAVVVYDKSGNRVREVPWAVPRNGWDGVVQVAIQGGVVVGELNKGERIQARMDPKSSIDPDDIVTVGDVGINTEVNADEYKKQFRSGYAVMGARLEDESYDPERARKMNEKRRKWAGKLRGHRIQIGGLPMFNPDAEYKMGDSWKPRVTGGEILSIGFDGSIWTRFGITNPHRLSRREMDNLEAQKSKSMDAYYKMGKAGIVLFYPDGRLRGWYLFSDDEVGGYPVGDAIYIERGYMTENERLVRLEPMKAK